MQTSRNSIVTEEEQQLEKKNKRTSAIITAAFYASLLILFLFIGLTTPLPLPAEQGYLVQFGNESMGDNPVPDDAPAVSESQEIEDEQVQPEQASQQPVEDAVPEPIEDIVTQDVEDAPVIKPEEKKPEEKQPNEVTKEVIKPSDNPEETTSESDKQVDEQPKKPPRESNPAFEFPGQKSGEGGSGNRPDKPGDPDGSKESDQKGASGSSELGGEGINFSLTGRKMVKAPKINDETQVRGIVAVEIKVDKQGNVLSAKAILRGSTTTDTRLWQLAEKAAKETRFSPGSSTTPEEQFGTMHFNFQLR
ncbi:MAG: energy transducer TonB [Bacteroidia bacterium]